VDYRDRNGIRADVDTPSGLLPVFVLDALLQVRGGIVAADGRATLLGEFRLREWPELAIDSAIQSLSAAAGFC